ncbi:hypothetical protein FD06_GL001259 [Apilactobacillus ozensis DSM 23829 = JCM 17196]|uniref:Peptidase C39-like domain-containing protein n=1 Tax=Apilactobacillus ozensis DSM 23829 = JCM 17196 TaxID=1423781 RepID=A0A0R2AM35_9LACO|nr:hypothetical protein FD06_GL001259 [Apilactobacillus ozensis DSM 23829 = JCM 17196]
MLGIFCSTNVYADDYTSQPSSSSESYSPANDSSNVTGDNSNQNSQDNNSDNHQDNNSNHQENNSNENNGNSNNNSNENNNSNNNSNENNNNNNSNNNSNENNNNKPRREIVFSDTKPLKYKTRFKQKWHKKLINAYKNNELIKHKVNSDVNVYIKQKGTLHSKTYYQIDSGAWINANYFDAGIRYIPNVPLIAQRPQLPTGCEITALTMMFQYAGVHKNKMQLAKEMPRSSNPNKGFVGSPYSKSGWYIYPKGLVKMVKKYLGSSKNMTGCSINKIKKQVNINHPVVVWLAHIDGFPNHALTVYGYDHKYIYLNDPWRYKRIKLNYNNFSHLHAADAKRTLSY